EDLLSECGTAALGCREHRGTPSPGPVHPWHHDRETFAELHRLVVDGPHLRRQRLPVHDLSAAGTTQRLECTVYRLADPDFVELRRGDRFEDWRFSRLVGDAVRLLRERVADQVTIGALEDSREDDVLVIAETVGGGLLAPGDARDSGHVHATFGEMA